MKLYKKVTALITNNRPGSKLIPGFLTVHNTSNESIGANAMANRNYFDSHPEVKASCHWIIDDKEAVLCIPETEQAWHTGTKGGNLTSIGVEVCENVDADQKKIYENALLLCADILFRHGWGIDKMRTHKSWSGKECPRKLLPKWDRFVNDVQYILDRMNEKKGGK